jgi:hypothetical protein
MSKSSKRKAPESSIATDNAMNTVSSRKKSRNKVNQNQPISISPT